MKALTERELEVLRFVAMGLTEKEIANRIHFSRGSVARILAGARVKLGALNTTNAVYIACKNGIL